MAMAPTEQALTVVYYHELVLQNTELLTTSSAGCSLYLL
jgi:hypothetical protein